LRQLLQYISGTIELPWIIGTNGMEVMQTWVDTSYAIHHDMRGHTGGVISMGHGVFHSKSSKQKLNIKSSTESEVVGASDYIPWTLWAKRFLEYQGYNLCQNIFYQDNESTIKIEKNGGGQSCGEKSRHINIRYFFIKDIIEQENMELLHCPTERMIADFYTKPIQGALFKCLRDIIMGISSFLLEEHVETNEIKKENNNDKMNKNTVKKLTYADIVRQANYKGSGDKRIQTKQ
jgi:hypothetical protein